MPQRRTRYPAARFAVLLVLLCLCGLALLIVPRPELAQLPHVPDRFGPFARPGAVILGALLLMALVPRTFVTLVWGAFFGPLEGGGYALAAAVLAAAFCFGVGRLLGRDFIRDKFDAYGTVGGRSLATRIRRRIARLDGWLSRTGLLDVITVRLLPLGGFGLVSYAYGITGARPGPYLVGSLIASAPSAFGYAVVGAAATAPDASTLLTLAPAGLGTLAMIAVLTVRWHRSRRPANLTDNAPSKRTHPIR